MLLLTSSVRQPDDDPAGSKQVAVWMYYNLGFDGYLFIYLKNGMHNLKKNIWANFVLQQGVPMILTNLPSGVIYRV